MAWLFVGILAYLFLSLSSLGDKLVLKGATKAISYTFFAGAMNLLAIFLLPFFEMNLPELTIFCWLIVDAIVFLFGLYLSPIFRTPIIIERTVLKLGLPRIRITCSPFGV